MNLIPEMTHELSRHWVQPKDIRDAPMDDTHVLLTAWQLAELNEYSHSMPSGVYFGKCWYRDNGPGSVWLCWYSSCDDPEQAAIEARKILIVA